MTQFPLISEILNISDLSSSATTLDLSKVDMNKSKVIGRLDGKDVIQAEYAGLNGPEEYFFTLQDNEPETFLCFQKITLAGIKGYLSFRAFTPPEKSGKGLMSELFNIARKRLKLPIFSDEKQTKAGNAFWHSLSKRYDVKVLDYNSGKILPRSEVSDELIFTDDDSKSLDYIFIIEGMTPRQIEFYEAVGQPGFGTLEPMRIFGEGDE